VSQPITGTLSRRQTKRSRLYAGWWVVVACFWIAVAAWGIGFYGQGIYLAQLNTSRGWSTSLISIAITTYYLIGSVLMIFVGAAIERLGSRAVVLGCTAALCLALILVPTVTQPWQLFAVYGLMAVGWAGTSWTAIPTILARWFDRRRGLAISIALTGASAGGILVPPLLIGLSAHFGFAAATWSIAGLVFLVVGTLAALALHRGPDALGEPVDGIDSAASRGATPKPTTLVSDTREYLGGLAFWSIAVAFALAFTTQVGFLIHQIGVLSPLLGAPFAGLAVAATTSASIAGRLGLGLIIDRLEPRAVSAAAFLLQAAAIVLLAAFHASWILLAACVLFGLWVGNITTLPSLLIQREFPARAFGTVVGLVTSISQFTFALGPAALGVVRDMSGGYGPVLAICAVLDTIAAVAILVPRWPRRGA
jgi:MFS family permease